MALLQKIVFTGSDEGGVSIEFHDGVTYKSYAFNDPDETFNTLQITAQCMEDDLKGKGIEYDDGYEIECTDVCANMMEKFSEPQLRAIMKVLYEHDLPSDLDVLAQEIQMRIR